MFGMRHITLSLLFCDLFLKQETLLLFFIFNFPIWDGFQNATVPEFLFWMHFIWSRRHAHTRWTEQG